MVRFGAWNCFWKRYYFSCTSIKVISMRYFDSFRHLFYIIFTVMSCFLPGLLIFVTYCSRSCWPYPFHCTEMGLECMFDDRGIQTQLSNWLGYCSCDEFANGINEYIYIYMGNKDTSFMHLMRSLLASSISPMDNDSVAYPNLGSGHAAACRADQEKRNRCNRIA